MDEETGHPGTWSGVEKADGSIPMGGWNMMG